jgi:phosphoesterase RecJ-like protein
VTTQLVSKLTEATHIIIISHRNPDGDAVGSLVALALGLESLGKKVTGLLYDPVPEPFQFLCRHNLPSQTITDFTQADFCIVVDTGDIVRTGYPEIIAHFAKINSLGLIDHHPRGDLYGQSSARVHITESASCAELVWQVLHALSVKITPTVATTLLTGMYTDTGGFQLSNTTSECLTLAGELLKRGAKLQQIVHEIHREQNLPHLRLAGFALERIHTARAGQMTFSYLQPQDIAEVGAEEADTSGIIGELNVLPSSRCSLLLIENEPGTIRGVLRSSADHPNPVLVHRLARLLGGGGHPKAAGFTISATITVKDDQPHLVEPGARNG